MTRTKSTLQKVTRDEKAESYVQMKGEIKTPENQLNEVSIGNLAEKEFNAMIVKMIQDFRKTVEEMQEMFTKDLEELKDKQNWIIH